MWLILFSVVGAFAAPDVTRLTPVPPDEPIPIGDFFRPPMMLNPTINRAGTHVAGALLNTDGTHRLFVYDVSTRDLDALDVPVGLVRWAGDRRLIYINASGLYSTQVGRLADVIPVLNYCRPELIGIPIDDPTKPQVWMQYLSYDAGRDGGVVEADVVRNPPLHAVLPTGPQQQANNEFHIDSRMPELTDGMPNWYLSDKNGHLAFACASRDGVPFLYRLNGERWERTNVDLEQTAVMSAGNQPGEVIALVPTVAGHPRALRFLDTRSGQAGATLLEDPMYEFDGGVYRDPRSRDIVGIYYDRSGRQVRWFDPAYAELQKRLEHGFPPGTIVRLLDLDLRGDRLLVATFSDRQPTAYYLVDLTKHRVELIKNTAPWIDPQRMRPEGILRYRTAENQSFDAYAILPKHASKGHPVPLLVIPNDGPGARWTWGYDSEAQFWAARGYAVLMPNYRGTAGYGLREQSDRWAFRAMSDDVAAATRTMIATGMIDPSRVAIIGSQFGGYLALADMVDHPGLFRCAALIQGTYDWAAMIKYYRSSRFSYPYYSTMLKHLGNPDQQREKFNALSPLRGVAAIRGPLFIVANRRSAALEEQNDELIAELEKHHIVHEAMTIPDLDQPWQGLKNDIDLNTKLDEFVQRSFRAPLSAPIK